MRNAAVVAALAAVVAVPASAGAAPRVLPAVKDELSAPAAKTRHCAVRAYNARGVDVARYRAPMSGHVTARLAAADSSDWDLTLFDAATGRALATSAGFGSREVTQTWVQAGQRLAAQGCRRKGRDRTATVSFRFVDAAPPALSGTPQLVKVRFRDRDEFERLRATGVDVTHNVHGGTADVVVQSAAQARALRRRGFSVETEIADLQRHFARSRRADARFASLANRSALPSGRESYRVYDDYQQELKDLAEDNTDIVKAMKLPRNSFQGRELSGLEIGERVNASAEDGRPVFLLVAMHHAREWPSSEVAMEFAHMLVQEYRTDNPRVKSLLQRARIVVVPLINPDGFISSRGFPADPADTTGPALDPNLDNPTNSDDPDDPLRHCTVTGEDRCRTDKHLIESIAPPGGVFAYRRKNCNGGVPNPAFPCELQYGVDPNRNYGEKWGGPGADADRTSQGYRGTGPWSESETQAVHLYSQRRQVTSLITLHNVAALVLRPPGLHFEGKAPDEARLKEIGDAMAAETGYTSQFGFELYDTAGTTEDWNYAAAGTYGFTIEIGPRDGEFHMPYETGVVKEWTGEAAGAGGLREALLIAAESAASEPDHGVIEGTAPAGRTLRLKKRFYTNTSAFCDEAVEPPVYFTGGIGTLLLPQQRCIGEHDPIAIPDKLETTLTVPPSGRFEWHVNPSTRPFVGKDKEIPGGRVETGRQTFSGPEPPAEPTGTTEQAFSLPAGVDHVEVKLTASADPVEDYDMRLYRIVDGAREAFGVGPNGTGYAAGGGTNELITAENPPAGDYVAVIENFAAVTNDWTLTVTSFDDTEPTIVPGRKEAWTLTCESPAGAVLSTRGIVIDRGQRTPIDLTSDCA